MNQNTTKTKLTVHCEIYAEQKKVVSDMINAANTDYYTDKVIECGIELADG